MIYAIIIWILTIILTIWILSRLHQTTKYLEAIHELKLDRNRVNDYLKSRFCISAIVIILTWWITFILIESFKLNFIQYRVDFSYQLFALLFLSPFIFFMQWKRNKIIKEKYNICIITINSRVEYALALLISIIYAQILSFAFESMMTFAV